MELVHNSALKKLGHRELPLFFLATNERGSPHSAASDRLSSLL